MDDLPKWDEKISIDHRSCDNSIDNLQELRLVFKYRLMFEIKFELNLINLNLSESVFNI